MSNLSRSIADLPQQQAIRAKCFHPTGTFIEFKKEEIEQSIPERFEKIVRQFPDRLAVKTKNGSLTYDELNKAANQLARAILARGGQGQEPVGLFLKDGVRLIAAHVAVLKAGKFSLGLDPVAPGTRTAHLLDDSQAALIIAENETEPMARQWAKGRKQLISIDEPDSVLSQENLGLSASPDAYCYLRYTSGSTGSAKGGLKTHRHVLHAVMNATNYFHICADDRSMLLNRASSLGKYAFEVLLNGAALCPFYVKEEGLAQLAAWLIQEQITIYYSFPTAFRHFLSALSDRKSFPKLRLIRLEGEPVYRSDVELYRKHSSSHCFLVNSFSSTETGPICLYFLDRHTDVTGTRVPAGYPVDGMKILLLDELRNEVGCNQPGEIVVQSHFLSSGYWQRPDLMQAKFLPQPEQGKEQIYFTDDLGQRSEDGCLELLGRKDFQIKIRSFRVDIGEVEAVLAVHPEVKEVTVVARNDQSNNTRLIAYLVPRRHPSPTISSLRGFLKEKLPDYMIPSAFVTLDRFPLIATGKVDRHALPEPGNKRPDLDTPFVAPRNRTEKVLAGIWMKLLGLKQVGIHDNFFDLGGHSLLAVRLFEQIEKEFSQRLPLSSLFQDATIEHLTGLMSQINRSTPWPAVVPLQPQGAKRPFFCMHELSGDVLCYMKLARHLGQDRPVYALQARGLDGIEEPFTDIGTMATYYIEKIRTVQPKGPYALGGLSFGGIVAFEMAQQFRVAGEAVNVVALLDCAAANSGYGNVTWGWSFLRNFVADLPYWLIGSLQLTRAQWLDLIRLKQRRAKARLAVHFRATPEATEIYSAKLIEEIGDLFHFSEQHRKVARTQYRALREYTPRVYAGRLTLFRARMQPFFSSHAPDKGWRKLAAGGLDIKIVPGNHLGMLQEPHVQVLAKQLRACLDQAPTGVGC